MKYMIRNNLFTFSFRTKTFLLRGISIFTCIGIFFGGIKTLNYMYNRNFAWERNTWHHLYSEEENIDNLFVGSSHVYCGINSFQMDELNGENNFNLAMASMRMNGCYYGILEATKENNVKNIYLDMYHGVTVGNNCGLRSASTLYTNWKSIDNMKFSLNKLRYQMNASGLDKYPETFFPFVRYREKLFDIDYIVNNMIEKKSEEYKNYRYSNSDSAGYTEYVGKGYMYTTATLDESALLYNHDQIELNDNDTLMLEEVEQCLNKIIRYCKEQGIRLTLFCTPSHSLHIEAFGDYDAYYSRVLEIADSNGIDFYDFNLCRQEYFDTSATYHFMDISHLNHLGAEEYTALLWKVLSGELTKEECFYPSYEEKKKQEASDLNELYEKRQSRKYPGEVFKDEAGCV